VTGQVDAKRRLPGATVAVEHHVAVFRDQRVVTLADERIGSGLVHVGELVERLHGQRIRDG
jgi:hypothetical protein